MLRPLGNLQTDPAQHEPPVSQLMSPSSHRFSLVPNVAVLLALTVTVPAASGSLEQLRVEVEEEVYRYEPANNGAGPLWCHGSTCIVRIGETVFVTGLETLADAAPLNNCRWMLFQRSTEGWDRVWTDETGRTREPSPIAGFPDRRLFVSANPTLVADRQAYAGPARPELFEFAAGDPGNPVRRWQPEWAGTPAFTEHSYRSLAADGPNRELILFQNIGYTHAEWAFLDRDGAWSAQGQLKWPWGAEYAQPQPIRICYPNVAIRARSVHFCGVSDIIEPNPEWRAYKRELTGREWDYDFRRLFYTWSSDIRRGEFQPWVEIASRETTAGWITPGDLWIDARNDVHILWTERALDERLRDKFFPTEKQRYSLEYAVVRQGKVTARRTLIEAREGGANERPGRGRFHTTSDHRLLVIFYVSGSDPAGRPVSENRLLEIRPDRSVGPALTVPFQAPFTDFFTATPRAGSSAHNRLDLLGTQAGKPNTISYARLRIR
jgi:hypothetical protein